MNRIVLGKRLASLRAEQEIYDNSLSEYTIQSIETGRASYSVSKMFLYADAIGLSVYVWDYNIDEHYRIGSVEDCHEIIKYLTEQRGGNFNDLNNKTGIRYTKPREGMSPLSIDTLLAILNFFHCSLQFDNGHGWRE